MSSPDDAAAAAFAAATRAPSILGGSITPFLIATIFVFARMYSRGFITNAWGHDDSWIACSWILALGLVTVNCTFPAYGSGHHQSTVPLKNIVPQLKLAYAQRLLYQLAVGTTKISLCFFYLRIFTDTKARLVSYGIMVFVAIYTVALFLTSLLGCIPISDIWSLAPKGKCTGKNGRLMVIYASGAVNIFTDVALLAFIIPRVLSLQMARRQRYALLAVVSMSIIVVIAAILRMVLSARTQSSKDFSWDGIYIAIWTGVEVNAGLFCASAPAIKPLLRKIAPGLLSSLSGGTTSYTHSGKRVYGQGSRFGTAQGSRIGGRKSGRHNELHSGTELDDMPHTYRKEASNITNTFWRSEDSVAKDSESERRVLDGQNPGQIRKTVSVMVTKHENVDDGERSSGSSVKKFEHV